MNNIFDEPITNYLLVFATGLGLAAIIAGYATEQPTVKH
jgi:hypothetical protein